MREGGREFGSLRDQDHARESRPLDPRARSSDINQSEYLFVSFPPLSRPKFSFSSFSDSPNSSCSSSERDQQNNSNYSKKCLLITVILRKVVFLLAPTPSLILAEGTFMVSLLI